MIGKVYIKGNFACGVCGQDMHQLNYVREMTKILMHCSNPKCLEHNKAYHVPQIEVKEREPAALLK